MIQQRIILVFYHVTGKQVGSGINLYAYAFVHLWGIISSMTGLVTTANRIKDHYWPLIKSRQTFLLTLTGVAGYLCQPLSQTNWYQFSSLVATLIITISGCSVLNMFYDRDIDRLMSRTRLRPLASGEVNSQTAAFLGVLLIITGLAWSATLSMTYFAIIFTGVFLNIMIYTLWLKRRTAWSILWGGLAGGMPILAGRVLASGQVDSLGVWLALIVIFWIPSHNLTLTNMVTTDYLEAGVPTFLCTYGWTATRVVVVLSGFLTSLIIMFVFVALAASTPMLIFIGLFSGGLFLIALLTRFGQDQKRISLLYKYSSLYMLVVMLILVAKGLR